MIDPDEDDRPTAPASSVDSDAVALPAREPSRARAILLALVSAGA